MSTRTGSKQGRPAARSTTKSSKDQNKGDKQASTVIEIVPGKFNETDWLTLLESDDTEDFIAGIFEDIWTDVSKQIQQLHVQKQLLPFTLMITENALSNVIQWAFLERDEPNPTSGTFWTEDTEPIPCLMDNWGEGVVPACREEQNPMLEESPTPTIGRPVSAPVSVSKHKAIGRTQRPSTGSSTNSSAHTSRSGSRSKKLPKIIESVDSQHQVKLDPWTQTDNDEQALNQNESSTEQEISQTSFDRRSYNHDVLVIQAQPPKLEPLTELFGPLRIATNSSSTQSIPLAANTKRRPLNVSKTSSQFSSDYIASATNLSDTASVKNHRKLNESKISDEQQIEEAISKAPVAAHAILKGILSRPAGYRELDLDHNGNVISMTKLDPDKIQTKNIRMKCDIMKSRKPAIEVRPTPTKQPPQLKSERSPSKYAPVKVVLPEQSTEVGDLIQPVPGVLYEDSRLKKGDPRQYQSGISKYTNYFDETHTLKPIAQRSDLAILQVANDLLHPSKNYDSDDDDNDRDSQIPRLRKFTPIPPITPEPNTTTA
ncbi:unnamed protein product [Adineta ricciae]|uniref:Uncharacterized protein n=1 Tax=Adineta ricciae TaxID=249248 RepID=A0A814ALX8_ADIRI|nr:unnamed protein product [Adineta ricciae]CAF1631588.1 unnamed protein product [Adineta ricciae]